MRSEGQREVEREHDPTVAETEHVPGIGGAERIVVHGGAPDVAAGLAGKRIIDGADQDGIAEGQE